jgi:hypothetical protein
MDAAATPILIACIGTEIGTTATVITAQRGARGRPRPVRR